MDFTFFCNVDAAHADDDETFRSTGGWFFFLRKGQGAVAAKSGQTKDIPLSSTESETIWGSSAAMQVSCSCSWVSCSGSWSWVSCGWGWGGSWLRCSWRVESPAPLGER
jgi:hypothetical protein